MTDFLDPGNIGGHSRVILEESAALAKLGHKSAILAGLERPWQADSEWDVPAEFWTFFYDPYRKTPYSYLRSMVSRFPQAICRRARKFRPDLIYLHQPMTGFLISLIPTLRRIPKVYAFHSPWIREYQEALEVAGHRGSGSSGLAKRGIAMVIREVEARALRGARIVRVLSAYMENLATDTYSSTKGRTRVIPGGIDLQRFNPCVNKKALRRTLGLPVEGKLLLTVRRLFPRMGLDLLIDSMVEIGRKHPNCILLIGGTGPLLQSLEAHVRNSGLHHRIFFQGFIPESKLPDFYASSDLFLLPTKALEGFGLVTLEAMASGTPVVATPAGAIPEILRPFDTACVSGSVDVGAFAQTVCSLLDNPAKVADLRGRARAYVKNTFSWDRTSLGLEQLFRETIQT